MQNTGPKPLARAQRAFVLHVFGVQKCFWFGQQVPTTIPFMVVFDPSTRTVLQLGPSANANKSVGSASNTILSHLLLEAHPIPYYTILSYTILKYLTKYHILY